jgi:hypothetical protein
MTRLPGRSSLVVLAAFAVLGCSFAIGPTAAQSAPAATMSCPSFRLDGSVFDVTIEKGSVSCRTAATVLRAFLSGKGKLHGPPNGPAYLQTWTLDGWSCGHGAGGGGCIRGGTTYKNARDYIVAQEPA